MGYFKGWYFKCCTKDKTIAFIPAYHRSRRRQTASLQIITDDAVFSCIGNCSAFPIQLKRSAGMRTRAYKEECRLRDRARRESFASENLFHNFPFHSLNYQEKPLAVRVGRCFFGQRGIRLNIQKKGLSVQGALRFRHLSPIQYDIMGIFQFVPFMQCRHSVYSMKHRIDGRLVINGTVYDFRKGIGYIEGDCGRSFPKQYIWTQCCFGRVSLMLSVADIPILGFHFTGIIGIVLLNGKEYRIATYLGARVEKIKDNTVTVRQGDYRLTAKLIEKRGQPLRAPIGGSMSRTIHESAACKAHYHFSYKGVTLCEFTSERASFEFEYS